MTLLLKNLAFTVLVPGTVAVYVPLLLAGERWRAASGASLWLGSTALALGAAVYAWCVLDFARVGRGTPAPIDAPRRLVARGPYRYTRNPMYLGVLTVILGWAILLRSLAVAGYGLGVWLAFHLFAVLYEEPRLRREFGAEYEAYARSVGRWLPRPRGRR